MAKRKIIKKRKTPVNIYADGAFMNKSRNAWGDFKGSSFQGKAGAIGAIGGAVTDIIGAGLNNAQISDTSNIQEEIDSTKSTVVGSNDFDSLMGEWGTWSPLDRINWRDIRGTKGGQQAMNTINASVSGASAGMQVGGPLGAIIGGAAGAIGGIAGSIRGRRKAKREARRLNREIEAANEQSLLALEDRADAIDAQNDLIALSNYAAKGGFINRFEGGGNTNKARRIDFENYKPLYDRGFIPANMNELQDSLINRGYKEPQRLAILSNVLHESGADPLAVDKTGKYKGGLQWDSTRHPGTDKWNEQINYIIKEATTPETPYWSDGSGGIPYIKNLKDGFTNFWNAGNPYDATLYYTKGNVRPSEEEARVNRAKEAQNMFKNLKAEGGSMNPQFNGMFPNDVTYIGNGGTHEYSEGQEYDVTEEEIKLLKKLGYEFEYL